MSAIFEMPFGRSAESERQRSELLKRYQAGEQLTVSELAEIGVVKFLSPSQGDGTKSPALPAAASTKPKQGWIGSTKDLLSWIPKKGWIGIAIAIAIGIAILALAPYLQPGPDRRTRL